MKRPADDRRPLMGRPRAGVLALALAAALSLPAWAADEAAVGRGAVLAAAGGCLACHTDEKGGGAPLAGGRALATPFGTFYSPNLTPDPQDGLGGWSEAQFRRALRAGLGRHGEYLFPVFPYPAFTGMTDRDIADLWAYLESRPAVARANTPHKITFPFGWRFLQTFWRALFFREGPLEPVAGQSAQWNRGRYLAEAVVHCQECHTPRNLLGGLRRGAAFSGNPQGPDGQKAPNITADQETGIGKWSVAEIAELLASGQTPDFDYVGSGMGEVVKGTAQLSAADRLAIATYIKSIPPIRTAKK